MGLSIRAYAQHRGVSHTAVGKAIKAGRIPQEPDGTIDPAKADAAWNRNTLPSQNLNAIAKPVETRVATTPQGFHFAGFHPRGFHSAGNHPGRRP